MTANATRASDLPILSAEFDPAFLYFRRLPGFCFRDHFQSSWRTEKNGYGFNGIRRLAYNCKNATTSNALGEVFLVRFRDYHVNVVERMRSAKVPGSYGQVRMKGALLDELRRNSGADFEYQEVPLSPRMWRNAHEVFARNCYSHGLASLTSHSISEIYYLLHHFLSGDCIAAAKLPYHTIPCRWAWAMPVWPLPRCECTSRHLASGRISRVRGYDQSGKADPR